ncbi:type I restriction modification DNA specificity domain protein [Leptospira interrogans serovar Canicola str. LT1962]|nr:type I restriction modification DNA specificity domain protein [Leptospira interrogans serovar Canicola str. LT1962]
MISKGDVIVAVKISPGKMKIAGIDLAINQDLRGLKLKDEISAKFLNYYFQILILQGTGTIVKAITSKDLEKIQIPIPPLPVQVEIVRILDAFTELTTELTAELTARKKQYNYYRDQLLSFDEGEVEWRALGEVAEIRRGTAITEKETTPGNVPVIANAPNPIYFHNKSNRDGETIVIARSGAYAGLVSYWNQAYFLTDAFSIHADAGVIKPKFAYHLLKREQEKIHQMSKGGGVPHVRAKDFEAYQIPIPPLAEQERIVAILDKFDALTNSISEGLPREIRLRQKQYEHYRELLLSFPKAEVGPT